MHTNLKKLLFLLLATLLFVPSVAQRMAVYSVAFYNQENLFDYEDDPNNPGDDEFLPNGPYNWTESKYKEKIFNMAYTISQLAIDNHCPVGPAVVGLAEVENERVVKDLVNASPLAGRKLEYVHYDSPDRRGIDVALLYNPKLFKLVSSTTYKLNVPGMPDFKTRDQLLVNGVMAGEPVSIIVNHWPSRYGGSKSEPLRIAAAELTRHIADEVRKQNPEAKVIIMGDLNDDPKDKSCAKIIGATRTKKACTEYGYYNTTWELYDKGIGTLCYQNAWCLYDQQIISGNFLNKEPKTLTFWKAEVFNRDYLTQKEGKNKGYPLRSFSNSNWQNGFSDHFPSITYYVKEM